MIQFAFFLLNTQISMKQMVERMLIICLLYQQSTATAGINGPQDESDAQQKVEATAENNAASNRSSGDAACIQRNKDLIEKGSDAQVSFPDLEIITFKNHHCYINITASKVCRLGLWLDYLSIFISLSWLKKLVSVAELLYKAKHGD